MVISPSRDSASHIQLLEQVIHTFPSDRWLLIEDDLGMHTYVCNTSRETRLALAAWPEIQIQFIPKYACWLRPKGVIEPWWKQVRSMAPKGRRFENADELTAALCAALEYWNAHKRPYHWKRSRKNKCY